MLPQNPEMTILTPLCNQELAKSMQVLVTFVNLNHFQHCNISFLPVQIPRHKHFLRDFSHKMSICLEACNGRMIDMPIQD